MAEKLAALVEDTAPQSGGNLTPDAFLAAYRQMRQAKRIQGEAAAEVARAGKRLKTIGVDRRAYDLFEKLMDLDTDEAKGVLQSALTFARWASHPIQMDMFAPDPSAEPSPVAKREFGEFEVEDAGYRAGFAGEKIEANPHSPDTPDDASYVVWRTGWHNGQAARVHKSFGGRPEEAESDQTVNAQAGTRPNRPRRGKAAVH
jgi:hypothetical protein